MIHIKFFVIFILGAAAIEPVVALPAFYFFGRVGRPDSNASPTPTPPPTPNPSSKFLSGLTNRIRLPWASARKTL